MKLLKVFKVFVGLKWLELKAAINPMEILSGIGFFISIVAILAAVVIVPALLLMGIFNTCFETAVKGWYVTGMLGFVISLLIITIKRFLYSNWQKAKQIVEEQI